MVTGAKSFIVLVPGRPPRARPAQALGIVPVRPETEEPSHFVSGHLVGVERVVAQHQPVVVVAQDVADVALPPLVAVGVVAADRRVGARHDPASREDDDGDGEHVEQEEEAFVEDGFAAKTFLLPKVRTDVAHQLEEPLDVALKIEEYEKVSIGEG